MLKIIGIILILLIVIAVVSFVRRFTIIFIEGESMSPTFKHGQIRLVDRHVSPSYVKNFGKRVKKGAVLTYHTPDGKNVIKRLRAKSEVSETETLFWFEGDNLDYSRDSRDYGFVSQERIYGEVITLGTFLLRTFAFKKSGILEEENKDG